MKQEYFYAIYNLALDCYQRADYLSAQLKLKVLLDTKCPDHDLFNLCALVERKLGNYGLALEYSKKAVGLNKKNKINLNNLGLILYELGSYKSAEQVFFDVLTIDGNFSPAHNNLGNIYRKSGAYSKALASYKKAISIDPTYLDAHNSMILTYRMMGEFDEALKYSKEILEKFPDSMSTYNTYASVLKELRRYDDAILNYSRVISRDSSNFQALTNRASCYRDLGLYELAYKDYQASLKIAPLEPETHFNLSLCYLADKKFASGFDEYEWRWLSKGQSSLKIVTEKRLWQGEKTSDKLLIWGEQGIGDEIMFGSLLSRISTLAENFLVQLDTRLIPIFERSFPTIKFITREMVDESGYQCHIPIGSLPRIFLRSVEDFELIRKPYLKSKPFSLEHIKNGTKKICGLSWKTINNKNGKERSINLPSLLPILRNKNYIFVNLQYGDVAQEIDEVKKNYGIEIIQLDTLDIFSDLDGFGALVNVCDCIVSIDNSTVHYAGALGKKVHVLLPYFCDWRWGNDLVESLWYKHVILHRQPNPNDWLTVVKNVSEVI